ncbi:hypothetical protein ACFL10_00385 [Patescibacteria group bacterium]
MTKEGNKNFPGFGWETPIPESEVEYVGVESSAQEVDYSEFVSDEEKSDGNSDDGIPDHIDRNSLLRDSHGRPVKLNGRYVTTSIPLDRIFGPFFKKK